MSYSIKPLLTPHEDRLASELKVWLGQPKSARWTILYKVQPSTFIKQELVEGSELRNALFGGLISFSIVERKLRGRLFATVVDERDKSAQKVKELFDLFDVSCLVCDLQSDRDAIKQFVLDSVSPKVRLRRGAPRTKPHTDSEWWLRENLEQYLSRYNRRETDDESLFVFQEPCLAGFIELPLEAPREHRDFASASRVDYLITSGPPAYQPLLVTEVDGRYHDMPKGKRNDRLKEAILDQANVPILRLRLSAMPFELWADKGDLVLTKLKIDRKLIPFYTKLLTKIVFAVVEGELYEKIQKPRIWKKHSQERTRTLASKIQDYMKLHKLTQLPNEAFENLWEDVEFDKDLAEIEIEATVESFSAFQTLSDYLIERDELTDRMRLTGSKLGDFKRDASNCYPMIATELITPKGTWLIKVPLISLSYIGKTLAGHKKTFDELDWQLSVQVAYYLAAEVLVEEEVPNLIDMMQFNAWMQYWCRPWTPPEREMLRALHQEGVSLKDMARRLERSQYHVYAELKRMLKIHRSDKDRGLREGLIKEAIDLSRAGMEPKKLRLAHSR